MTPEEILKEEGIYFIPKGKDLLISCLNPEHEDSSPSTRVDAVSGIYNCLSCGDRGNLYFKYQVARDIQSEHLRLIRGKIKDIIVSTIGREIPPGSVPYNRNKFKEIPVEVLNSYDAFTNDLEFADRIVFPIRDPVGRIIAFNGRSLYTDQPPKYLVYPAEVELPFFPAIIKPLEATMIVVEGLFDQINLQYHGLPNVVCLFGTNKISERNVNNKLSSYRVQGVQKIIIMFDGDQAGIKASLRLKKILDEKTEFVSQIVYLNEGDDPGVLTAKQVNFYKQQIYSKESNAN